MSNDMNLKALHMSVVTAIRQFPTLEQSLIPNPQGTDIVIGIFKAGTEPHEERLLCWIDDEPSIYYLGRNKFDLPEVYSQHLPLAPSCQRMPELLAAFAKET